MKKLNLFLAIIAATAFVSAPAFAGEWNNTLWPRQYKKDDGSLAVSEWIHHNDAWYHFDADGYAQRGWYQSSDGKWYFLRYDGIMQTGLIKVNTEVYYMDDSGALFEGEKEIYGNAYEFTANGVKGRAPGVLQENIFGIDGGQAFENGGSSSAPSSSSDSGNSGFLDDLKPGQTNGPK